MVMPGIETGGLVSRGELATALKDFKTQIITGQIQQPIVVDPQVIRAGGNNHYPNSDCSFSTRAATVVGTLPTDVFDDNYELWRAYWAVQGANVIIDAVHTVKSVDHTLYAATEGVDHGIPIWDRVNGWISQGAAGATQYDVLIALPRKIVGPGERWYFVWRVNALTNDDVPVDLEAYAGLWQVSGGYEGWAKGEAFDLTYELGAGTTPGTTDTKYRVMALSDSGFAILSSVLDVPDAPDALSSVDYVKIFHNAGSGFIEYRIYRLRDAVYEHLYTVRNSNDLQYNDTGVVHFPDEILAAWPVEPQDRPIAYAETGGASTLVVGPFGQAFQQNALTISVPGTYASGDTNTDGQYIRFGLKIPTTVDRQIAFDKFWFGTTFNSWAPDNAVQFTDSNFTIPSSSPNSGNPGNGGVINPPDPGSGGGTACVRMKMPVLTSGRRGLVFKPYDRTDTRTCLKGERLLPYEVVNKRTGMVSEWYQIKTANGIRYECSAPHRLVRSVAPRKYIQARQVRVGTELIGRTIQGREFKTRVASVRIVPKPARVGTYVLRDPTGELPVGRGLYVAGYSPKKDRGLYSSNEKPASEF